MGISGSPEPGVAKRTGRSGGRAGRAVEDDEIRMGIVGEGRPRRAGRAGPDHELDGHDVARLVTARRTVDIVGGRHAKLKLQLQGRNIEAMQFNALQPLPERIRAAYRLSVNEFNGVRSVQLLLEHWEPAIGS